MRIALDPFMHRHLPLEELPDLAARMGYEWIELSPRSDFLEWFRAPRVFPDRIVARHIVPNLLGVVVVYMTLTIPQAILVESFLSFLGLGVQEPQTSLGALVNNGVAHLERAPWLLLLPAAPRDDVTRPIIPGRSSLRTTRRLAAGGSSTVKRVPSPGRLST